MRIAIAIAGTVTFVLRTMGLEYWPGNLVPYALAVAGIAFLFLYEAWMRDLVAGPIIPPDGTPARRALIRHVFTVELVLIGTSVASAHTLLGVDWTRPGVLTQS